MSWFGLSSNKPRGWIFDRFVQFWQNIFVICRGKNDFLKSSCFGSICYADLRDWGLKVKVCVRLL